MDELDQLREAMRAAGIEITGSIEEFIEFLDKQQKSSAKTNKKTITSFDQLQQSVDSSSNEMDYYTSVVNKTKAAMSSLNSHINSVAGALGSMTESILANGEGLGMFRSMITPVTDMMAGVADVAGNLVEGFGDLFDAIPILGDVMGGLTGAIGGAISAVGKLAAGIANFVLNLGLDAVEQLWGMFEGATQAGVLFANGLQEMNAQRSAMNLTTQEYTSLMKNAGAQLVTFGGSVGDGAKKLARITKLNDEHAISLRALGIGYEEQAEQTADLMASMARTGHLRSMTDQQVADTSFEYMKSLRVISALTGKSADQMKEEQKQAANNIAFQAKLAKMDAEQRNEVNAALAATPAGLQQAFKESVVFGQVMTDVGAIATGSAKYIEEFAANVTSGGMTAKDGFQTFSNDIKAAGPTLRQSILGLEAAGMAALLGNGGPVATSINDFGAGMLDIISQAETRSPTAVEQAEQAAEARGGIKELLGVMDKQRNIQDSILKLTEQNLPAISDMMSTMATGMADAFAFVERNDGNIERMSKEIQDKLDKAVGVDVEKKFDDVTDQMGDVLEGALMLNPITGPAMMASKIYDYFTAEDTATAVTPAEIKGPRAVRSATTESAPSAAEASSQLQMPATKEVSTEKTESLLDDINRGIKSLIDAVS